MGKANKKEVKRSSKYKPFYPTTLGSNSHDVTFLKLPSYSIRPKPDPVNKKCSPGPAAYPGDSSSSGKKKYRQVPNTIYPQDKAHKYSMGIKGNELRTLRTPGPAAYPFEETYDKDPMKELPSIYPKDKGNIFSMRKKKELNYFTVTPGPAIYPRDAEHEGIINSIHPRDLANKFSMVPRRDDKIKLNSPGPAVYPNKDKDTGDKNKMATIYPPESQLPPTMKGCYNIKDRQKRPAPNAYPVIEGKHDPKRFKLDFMKKMVHGKRAPVYSLGIRHTPKQQYLVLLEDEY